MAVLRTVILYVVIIAALRLMGKRQIGELEPSELVVTLLMSELAAVPMQDLGSPLVFGLVPIATLLCLSLVVSGALIANLRFRALLCGKPSVLMKDGRILQRELRKNRLTIDELIEALRAKDITDLSTVQYAVLETNGTLSAILYPAHQPATRRDVGATVPAPGLPVVLVSDGALLREHCAQRNLSPSFLADALKQNGLADVREAFLLIVDEQNRVYCLPKEPKR
ncbi:MAG: DUF421 domain-containing protein [Oscillospiraceae bacterium]|nr:DUF421 domain-containing protein [Oscillospiraceae bacterium]